MDPYIVVISHRLQAPVQNKLYKFDDLPLFQPANIEK